ncbi:MAG: energy-coupling factor transporter ATPase [Clostridiales bacterium]|nr:energy-coupling factor transporter ATPase [Clostridiales bacterium]
MSITVKNLSYTYMPGTPFEHQALKNVSFEIADGEFVGIIGHTGSGKSTLIQVISGLLDGAQGQVLIGGVDYMAKKADRKQLRRTLGVVFQYPEYQLFEETVEKDVAYGPRKMGIPESEIAGRVRVALEHVGIDYELYKDKSPFSLSGGQKRKIAIAGVLAMEPSILILDEPIAGLDPMGRENFMQLSRDLNETGITILMISHNMDNLAEYAGRVLVMNDGELYLNGTPKQVFAQEEKLLAAGLDLPEAAKLAGQLRARGMDVPPGIIRYDEMLGYLAEKLGGREQ